MTFISVIQVAAALIGFIAAGLVLLFRRFGPASWLLCGFLTFGAFAPCMLALAAFPGIAAGDLTFRLAISSLILACPCGLLFTWSVDRPDYRRTLAEKGWFVTGILLPIPFLLVSLFLFRPTEAILPSGFIVLGPGGYFASLYLLAVSVIGLASLEQTVRSVDEHSRWEIKFLLLGLAAAGASIIFAASKVLLYSFPYALLPMDDLNLFSFIFPVACALILISWRRSSGRSTIRVSQSFVYSSITLLAVGIYLIASSLIARWVSQWEQPGIQVEAIVFLLAIIVLAAILLTTQFRHRLRVWIHRNIFHGTYDYRRYWLEASEKVRSVDDPRKAAEALASVIQGALGAIDISVWLRTRNPDRLIPLAQLGSIDEMETRITNSIVGGLLELNEPASDEDLAQHSGFDELREFMRHAHAALLVPLVSSDRIVGLVTVGADRSGRPFDREAREFLRVLGNHAAGEFHKSELLATLVQAKETEAFKLFSTFLLHDLKNFASTLSLIAKNAARHQDNPDFQRDAFQSVFDTAEKMKRLCNNLRTFSSNLAANRKQADLNQIVHGAVAGLNAGLSRHLHLELAKLPPVFVDADELTRVLQNLLLNAREAISSEGSIIVTTKHNDDTVELAVQDDGKGMPKEFVDKELFLPFHTTKSDGLGIGLFQSKKIIEAHGGSISVDSVAGKGTIVRVRLPQGGEEPNTEGTVRPAATAKIEPRA
jgi:putative PEP-CTERM system histidine kinase